MIHVPTQTDRLILRLFFVYMYYDSRVLPSLTLTRVGLVGGGLARVHRTLPGSDLLPLEVNEAQQTRCLLPRLVALEHPVRLYRGRFGRGPVIQGQRRHGMATAWRQQGDGDGDGDGEGNGEGGMRTWVTKARWE